MSSRMICYPISHSELSVSTEGPVTVVAGIHSTELNIAGLTIEEVYEVISPVFNIDEQFDPYVNGELVQMDAVL